MEGVCGGPLLVPGPFQPESALGPELTAWERGGMRWVAWEREM